MRRFSLHRTSPGRRYHPLLPFNGAIFVDPVTHRFLTAALYQFVDLPD